MMLSNELIIFCERWLKKADKYTNDTTEDVFDKLKKEAEEAQTKSDEELDSPFKKTDSDS